MPRFRTTSSATNARDCEQEDGEAWPSRLRNTILHPQATLVSAATNLYTNIGTLLRQCVSPLTEIDVQEAP